MVAGPPEGRGPVPAHNLLERDEQFDAGVSLLSDVRDRAGGAVMMVEGPPGVGRTALLDAISPVAADAGFLLLRAAGSQVESGFPYGIVRQLFLPVVRSGAVAVQGPSRLAGAALGLTEVGVEPQPDHEILHGLFWLVTELASIQPVLLVIDDAHRADPPSQAFVAYLAQRVGDLPVAVMLATPPPSEAAAADTLRRIGMLPATRHLRLAELSSAASAELVRRRLGSDADDEFCQSCHDLTAGNPFLLNELLAELAGRGVPPSAPAVPRLADVCPGPVVSAVHVRLAQLPSAATPLAEALAVLGPKAPLRHVAAVAQCTMDQAAEAEGALLHADLIQAGEWSITFRHPLVRQVLVRRLSPGRRTLLHGRAAEVLHRAGEPGDDVVAHLLASAPSGAAWRLPMLRDAAARARERGAHEGTVAALRRVLTEFPATRGDPAVLEELGTAELAALDPGAVGHLQQALQAAPDPDRRSELVRKLARAHIDVHEDMGSALAVVEDALADSGGVPADGRLRLEADVLSLARLNPDTRRHADQRLAELRASDLPDDPAAAAMLANLALHALESTEPVDVVASLANRALADPERFYVDSGWVFSYAANSLTWADRTDDARAAWDAAIKEGQRRGSFWLYGFGLLWRAHLRVRTGELVGAEADIQTVYTLATDTDSDPRFLAAYGAAFLADIIIDRGDLDRAEELLGGADPEMGVFVYSSLSRVHHARGRFEQARDAALAAGEALRGKGGRDSPGVIPWRSEAARPLAVLGQVEEAQALVEEEVALARRQGGARAIGMALRTQALVQDRPLGLLEEACEVLERSSSRLELARTLIDLGTALRQSRRRVDARGPLRQALDLAHRCGATTLEGRAREELLAAGARPRRGALTGLGSLTPTELRVARMAAEGRTNRQIAQALFVSMSTVATHLNHAYRKLNIEGRADLPGALS